MRPSPAARAPTRESTQDVYPQCNAVSRPRARSRSGRPSGSFAFGRMYFRDIAPGELHQGCLAATRDIGSDQSDDAAFFPLEEHIIQVSHFVAGHFMPERV